MALRKADGSGATAKPEVSTEEINDKMAEATETGADEPQQYDESMEAAQPELNSKPAAPAQKKEEAKKEEAKPEEAKVAIRQDTSLSTDVRDLTSLIALKNNIDPSEFGYGDIPRIVASNGLIFGPEKVKLGSYIDVQVLSYSERFMASPGSDDDAAKSLVRASYDGKTLAHGGTDNGRDIDEYIDSLRKGFKYIDDEGKEKTVPPYPKAAKKEYFDVFCLLIGAEKADVAEDLAMEGMLNISLSPQSKGKFSAYAKQLVLTVKRGLIAPEKAWIVRFKATVKSANGKDFTLLVPFAPPKEVSDKAEIISLG